MTTNRKRRFYVIQFNSICQILAKLSEVRSERTVSKFRKRKRKFWVVLTYFVKRVIRKFHVAVMQQRLRDVHKSVMHVQSRCRNCASMVTWRHTSFYIAFSHDVTTAILVLQNNDRVGVPRQPCGNWTLFWICIHAGHVSENAHWLSDFGSDWRKVLNN